MECPKCAGRDIILITYGTPPLEGARLAKAIEEKSIVLGGCVLCGDTPAYYCRSCAHKFGDLSETKRKRKWFRR